MIVTPPTASSASSHESGSSYAQGKVARCLARDGLSEESNAGFTVAKPSYRKLFPPGIIGSISVPAPAGSSSRFDHVLLRQVREGAGPSC